MPMTRIKDRKKAIFLIASFKNRFHQLYLTKLAQTEVRGRTIIRQYTKAESKGKMRSFIF